MKKLLIGTVLSATILLANQNTGCGFGSMVIENQNSVVTQVLAHTTNGTSGSQTFGITSGTLGCEKPASFVMNEKLLNFVALNIDAIAIDAAKGSGETLNTLATLMEVENTSTFGEKIQSNFDLIFTNKNLTSAQLINNISNIAI